MSQTFFWIGAAVLLIISWVALRWRQTRRRRLPYVAAHARIEGGGVKRGLTPPEGAILLGRPLNMALTLVIFEMLRKGFVRQSQAWPLVVTVSDAFALRGSGLSAQARGEQRRLAAQSLHKAMHPYEEAFLEILEAHPGTPLSEIDYSIAIQPLVRYVAGRVGGYNLEETRAYYRLIVERAPREARSDGVLTFEREKVFDRNFGWVLMGEDFTSVLDRDDYSYTPVWMRKQRGETVNKRGRASADTGDMSFAEWATAVIEAMEGAVAEEDVKLGLKNETDSTTVTLMNEIARATFYG